jgi:transposase-like protein
MDNTTTVPSTLRQAVRYFSDPDAALQFVASLRWPDGVKCVHCGQGEPSFLKTRRIWKCRKCRKQFSVKVGTIFEDSAIGLDKWLPALWLLANAKNGISSYELHRALGVTQKTAWFMLHRVRLAMQTGTFQKMRGKIEVDEAYLGGKSKFMHLDKRARVITKRGVADKLPVLGILQRKGKKGHSTVIAKVTRRVRKKDIQPIIKAMVAKGSLVSTDALLSYEGLAEHYRHEIIDHASAYVRGEVHTNCLENFWSLLKRTIRGTYVSVDPFHVFRYLDEQCFRFNNRDVADGERFVFTVRQIIGKRLTYSGLIGHSLTPATT